MRRRRVTPSGLPERQSSAYCDAPEALASAYTGIVEPKNKDATEKDVTPRPLHMQYQVKKRVQKKL